MATPPNLPNPAPENRPPENSPVSLTCPCCKSVVTYKEGTLSGGKPSPELERLHTNSDRCAVLEGEFATSKQENATLKTKVEELEADNDPAPEPKYFL